MKIKSAKEISEKARTILVLTVIFLLGFLLRLYGLNSPVADFNSKEQSKILVTVKNVASSNEFIGRYNKSLLESKLNDNPDQEYNPSRLLIYEIKTSIVSTISGLTPTQSGRVINITTFLVLVALMYSLCINRLGKSTAMFTTSFLLFSPISILYSRQIDHTILPLTLMLGSIFLINRFTTSHGSRKASIFYFFSSLVISSTAISSSPVVIVFLLPIAYLFYKRSGLDVFRRVYFYAYLITAIIPCLLINLNAGTLPDLIPLPIWASQINRVSETTGITLFDKLFITEMLKNRLVNTFLGGLGIAFVLIGILKKKVATHLGHYLLLAAIVSTIFFPKLHYYQPTLQILFLPSLSLYFGIGISFLTDNRQNFVNNFFSVVTIFAFLILSIFLSYQEIIPYYKFDGNKVQLAQIISTLTGENDTVATDTKGDPILLYLSNRKGIPTTDSGDTELINNGTNYLVTTNQGYARDLSKKYVTIFASKSAFVIKLPPKSTP